MNSHKIFVPNHINIEYFNAPIPRSKRTNTNKHIRDQSSNAVRGTVDAGQSSARSSDVSTPSSDSGSETTNYTPETVQRVINRDSDGYNNNMHLTGDVESTEEGANYQYIPLSPDNLLSDMDQKGKVEEMVKRICGRRMDKIYSREDLFHMFLRLVVKNVIFKNNWNHKRDSIKYYKYVTVSDEAFAMLMLENHGERYMHMMDGKDLATQPAPKYTQVKGSSSINKGWSDEGKMRYMELVMETERWRSENLHRMELLSIYVLKRETAISKKKQGKRSVEDMDDGTTVSSRLEAQTKRKQFEDFLKRSALKRNDSMSFEGASLSFDGGIE